MCLCLWCFALVEVLFGFTASSTHWSYDVAQKSQIACMCVNLCVFRAQGFAKRASGT